MKSLTERERQFVYKRLFSVIENDIIKTKTKEDSDKKVRDLAESRKSLLKLTEFKKVGVWETFNRNDVMEFMDNNNLDCLRFCENCGKPFWEGYITEDGDAYCSCKCMGMTEKELEEQYSDDEDCTFYTELV